MVERVMIFLEWIIVEYGSYFRLEVVLVVLRLRGGIEHSIDHRYALEDGVLPFVPMCRSLVRARIGSM